MFKELKVDFPALLALMMTVIFAVVTLASGFLPFHPDQSAMQTLLALTALTWGYYFGSSKSTGKKDDAIIASMPPPTNTKPPETGA